jgi:tripartite-type tricarboxylate transporter receptor subunit TctC
VGTAGPLAINPHLFKSLPFDPLKDFAPIVLVARFPQLLAVNATVPANTVADLVALMKGQPNKLNYGSAGIGAAGHVIASTFLQRAGAQAAHIPYKGGGSLMQALLAGDVQFVIDGLPTFFGPLKSGKVRALGVTTLVRASTLPDVPTLAESGFPGFDYSAWILLAAPAGTPEAIIERLAKAVSNALRDEQIVAQLEEMGATIAGGDPRTAQKFLATEYARWKEVVVASGAKLE